MTYVEKQSSNETKLVLLKLKQKEIQKINPIRQRQHSLLIATNSIDYPQKCATFHRL